MKIFKRLLSLSFIGIILVSCSENQEVEKTVIEKTFALDMNNDQNLTGRSVSTSSHTATLSFSSETPMNGMSEEEYLNMLMDKGEESLNGEFMFKIDGKVRYHSIIVDGHEYIVTIYEGDEIDPNDEFEEKKSYECTFNGLSKCTQDRIDSMNTLEKLGCIAAGMGCVEWQFAYCAWDHCGGQDNFPL